MKIQPHSNWNKTSIICIDEYKNKIPVGRIYDEFFEGGIEFQGVMELLLHLDSMLEELNYPQSFAIRRVFRPAIGRLEQHHLSEGVKVGKVGTFSLKILFRQNASWQGAVTWHEGKSEEGFRSVLELLFLLDSALNSSA